MHTKRFNACFKKNGAVPCGCHSTQTQTEMLFHTKTLVLDNGSYIQIQIIMKLGIISLNMPTNV